MMIITTQRDPQGNYRDVGMNYRALFGPFILERNAMVSAKRFANNKPTRVEFFRSADEVRSNKKPFKVIFINEEN